MISGSGPFMIIDIREAISPIVLTRPERCSARTVTVWPPGVRCSRAVRCPPGSASVTLTRTPPATDTTDRVALMTALARLAPLDRAVVVLRFWEDRSVAQTATDPDMSEAAVKNRSLRALRTLREHLAPADYQPTHHRST